MPPATCCGQLCPHLTKLHSVCWVVCTNSHPTASEASEHFGEHLTPFVPQLAKSDGRKPFAEQNDLPVELKGAMIACHGDLTPPFAYIRTLRASNERADTQRGLKRSRNKSFVGIKLVGHLFDSGIINQVRPLLDFSTMSGPPDPFQCLLMLLLLLALVLFVVFVFVLVLVFSCSC